MVEEHPDEKCERIVGEQVVGGGVSGDVKGHGVSLASTAGRAADRKRLD